ncbi:MAG: energy transducer TonB [Janthinobacterium lividum]
MLTTLPSAAQTRATPPSSWPHLLRNGKQVTLTDAIRQSLVYPPQVIRDHIEGWVFVRFKVMPDGSVKDARIAESLQYDCDVAALLAVRRLPQFEPLSEAGKPIAVDMTVPIKFSWRTQQPPTK